MSINWEPYKDQIIALHHERLPLHSIREIVSLEHDFNPSERTWRTQLKKWGCMTYHTGSKRPTHLRPRRSRPPTGQAQDSAPDRFLSPNRNSEQDHIPAATEGLELATNLVAGGETERSTVETESWGPEFLNLERPIETIDPSVYPLHSAIQKDNHESLEKLFYHRADVDSQTSSGLTPLHLAMRHSSSRCWNLLLLKIPYLFPIDRFGNTPVHWAIRWKFEALRDLMGLHESLIGARNHNGFTAFHLLLISVRKGHRPVGDILAIFSLLSGQGYIDLSQNHLLATGEFHLDFLLSAGARGVDLSTCEGRRKWWRALLPNPREIENLKLITRMIPRSAIQTPMLPDGSRSLFKSLLHDLPMCEISFYEISRVTILEDLLLELLPLEVARSTSVTVANELLEAHAMEFWKRNCSTMRTVYESLVREFCAAGPRIPAESEETKASLLVNAVEYKCRFALHTSTKIVSTLLSHGFDGFALDPSGVCALLKAVMHNYEELMEAILDADWDCRSTPTHTRQELYAAHRTRLFFSNWEHAKQTNNLFHAVMILVRGERSPEMSYEFNRNLTRGAIRLLLRRYARHECWNQPERQAQEKQAFVSLLDRCRKSRFKVEFDTCVYSRLLDLCVSSPAQELIAYDFTDSITH